MCCRYTCNELLWGMMNIIGPPSDADIQQMKCSDVMAPVLLNYVCKIRKAKATQQQEPKSPALLPAT